MEEQMYILIAKSLNQEATAAEQQQLESWLKEAAANRSIYDNMKAIWSEADTVLEQPVFDVTAAWEKVAAQTTDKAPEKKTITFRKWFKVSAAAAALLLIVFAVRFFTKEELISITANEKMLVIDLPDHSKVRLHKGSTLRYPETFSEKHRDVRLEGEAFFDIVHKEEQPFTVDATTIDVSVLGTSFYVTTDDKKATVTVVTGKVAMASKDHAERVILNPGNKGIYKEHQFNIVTDTNFVYYEQGILEFKNTRLTNAIQVIANVTNSNIVIDKNTSIAIQQQLVEITFRDPPLEKMLDEICLITNTHWKKDKEQYHIYAK